MCTDNITITLIEAGMDTTSIEYIEDQADWYEEVYWGPYGIGWED